MAAPENEEAVTEEFLDWLEAVSGTETYRGSFFRVIFDGSYRPVGPTLRRALKVTFAESATADELIYETAEYLYNNGERVAVVSSDKLLQQDLKALGIKTMFCQKFFNKLNNLVE
ncbi:hypothetical protein FACS189437_01180 [Bacteroidia bacterium]|nr:hypothetical protein FACS189437_01180 [Bacteroidia bacterium]